LNYLGVETDGKSAENSARIDRDPKPEAGKIRGCGALYPMVRVAR